MKMNCVHIYFMFMQLLMFAFYLLLLLFGITVFASLFFFSGTHLFCLATYSMTKAQDVKYFFVIML